jgi:D-alanine-D-alanine ligase
LLDPTAASILNPEAGGEITSMDHGPIGVIAGGDSPERAVSLMTGERVTQALHDLGHAATLLKIEHLDDLVSAVRGMATVFNCLHGGAGEDGTVQLLFEVLGIAYPGSGPQASALCMDKARSKDVLSRRGIPVPRSVLYSGGPVSPFCERTVSEVGLPLVLKPTNQGSSVGVRIVEAAEALPAAITEGFEAYGPFLVEAYIPGRELTAGILQIDGVEQALPIVEMRPKNRFAHYDYEAKYTDGMTEFLVPAPLDESATKRVQEVALAAHRALGCSGFSRIDLRLHADGTPYVLEANTLPGMPPTSDLPRAAAAAGIRFNDLVALMLETATPKEAT